MKTWIICCAVLCVLALFFFFCMNGYTYISYTLLFIAFLITVRHVAGIPVQRAVAAVTAVGLIYFCFVEFRIISNAHTDADAERDYLIVLGAGVRGEEASLSLQHRLEGAAEYLQAHPASRAILSGGQGKGEDITEAECMRRWLSSAGIDGSRLLLEETSTSTMENLRNSWAIIQAEGGTADDVAVLSSNYHLYRAKLMAQSLGMHPAGVRGNIGYPIYTLGMFIREAFGVTHLWILGR